MTTAQVTALTSGMLVFAVVWAVVLVPQVLGHLARFGRVDARRVATTAAVTLYACLAVAVVLLPLPTPGEARLTQLVQPVPFQWVADVGTELDRYASPTLFAPLTQTFQQFSMNVLLFVPLGVIVLALWRRGARFATLSGLGLSLLVEITQLTANFGTAPYAYRIFDVDDLMANTAGAALGWLAARLFVVLRRLRATNAAAPERRTRPLPHPTAPGVPGAAVPACARHAGPRTPPSPPRR
ncbi:VanZ family protein [Saccharomonospora piscinae]|uniref:VanZ family protein n=1 Tax=Saccharomonospora piscinae TaxID=687388 RepID=A0A1V9A0Q4_SACPI|nr:VanZ family protein [Saccharomonospora piscinae]OQO90608.1 VanZ family protein [Saccharomonospora piscinae]